MFSGRSICFRGSSGGAGAAGAANLGTCSVDGFGVAAADFVVARPWGRGLDGAWADFASGRGCGGARFFRGSWTAAPPPRRRCAAGAAPPADALAAAFFARMISANVFTWMSGAAPAPAPPRFARPPRFSACGPADAPALAAIEFSRRARYSSSRLDASGSSSPIQHGRARVPPNDGHAQCVVKTARRAHLLLTTGGRLQPAARTPTGRTPRTERSSSL